MSNKKKQTIEPRLRFPEFQDYGGWEKKKIGDNDFAIIYKGKGISKSDITQNGKTFCIRYGELYTCYGEVISTIFSKTNCSESSLFLSRKNDVIIPASGETKVDIATASCVTLSKVALGSDLNIIRSQHNGIFISYYLNGPLRHEIAKVAQGHSVVHLYPSQLKKIEILVPTKQEQQKIADCLSSIDELITDESKKLDALKAHKKGLTQQLFPAEGETLPKIRFPEFQDKGEWHGTHLSEVLTYERPEKFIVSSTNYKASGTPVLTANKSFILGYTDEAQNVYEDLPVIIFDDFTTDKKYVDFPFKIKSSAIKILKIKGKNNLKVVFELIDKIYFNAKQHKRYYISEYQNLFISLPSIEEQQKIADCLSSIDVLITTANKKIEVLKNHKKGLMQQLFPTMCEL